MIKFFRTIRQRLLSESKFSKYLIYALGEVVLVVIGILIALQINNWNQNRLNDLEGNEIIAKLHSEFKENKLTLNEFVELSSLEMSAHIALIGLIGSSEEVLSGHNLDSLFYESIAGSELAFADNTINDIIQSGRLKLLKNEELLNLLYKWNELSEIRKTRIKKLDDWANNLYVPYLLSKISLREVDTYSNYEWAGKSKVKPNFHPLFQELEFENHLENMIWYHQKVEEIAEETKGLIDEIIATTTPN